MRNCVHWPCIDIRHVSQLLNTYKRLKICFYLTLKCSVLLPLAIPKPKMLAIGIYLRSSFACTKDSQHISICFQSAIPNTPVYKFQLQLPNYCSSLRFYITVQYHCVQLQKKLLMPQCLIFILFYFRLVLSFDRKNGETLS